MFECPTCQSKFELHDFLEHAKTCTSASTKNGSDSTNDDSAAANHENPNLVPPVSNNRAPIHGFTCPLCSEQFPMAEYAQHAPNCSSIRSSGYRELDKRSNAAKQEEAIRKRPRMAEEQVAAQRFDNIGGGVTMQQSRMEPSHQAAYNQYANRETMIQPPLPTVNQAQQATPAAIFLNNSAEIIGEFGPSSNAVRERPQLRRNETPLRAQEPLLTSSRISTPLSQNVGSPLAAAVPRRLKEEVVDYRGANGDLNGGGGGDGGDGAAAGNPQDGIINILQEILRRQRQMGAELENVRRRVEMFEASMMMKLTTLENLINRDRR